MFDSMYFTKSVIMDGKNRIMLPAKTGAVSGEQIAIVDMSSFYGLYILERLDKLVNRLRNERFTGTEEQYEMIVKQLNYVYNAVKTVSSIDSQRRVLLPSEVANENDGGKVVLQGRKDHVAMFMTQTDFEEYLQGDNFKSVIL